MNMFWVEARKHEKDVDKVIELSVEHWRRAPVDLTATERSDLLARLQSGEWPGEAPAATAEPAPAEHEVDMAFSPEGKAYCTVCNQDCDPDTGQHLE